MTEARTLSPVLLLGGTGKLGAATARTLRWLQPGLPITLVARDLEKAEALAKEIGIAHAARVDLGRADLALPPDASFSAVVTCLKDLALNSMRYAQALGIPYFALSEAAFEIGAHTARYIHRPSASPVVLGGHSIGSVPMLAALHFAHELYAVEAIDIGLVFDPDDVSGPMTVEDMERIASVVPSALMLVEGRWRWVQPDAAVRTFEGAGGVLREGSPAALLDSVDLAASTHARSVRVDLAEGPTATALRGEGPSHEIVIEIRGRSRCGLPQRHRHEIVERAGYATLSGLGVALCVERALGLAGGAALAPGLYTPAVLVDPAYLIRKLRELGTCIASTLNP
jgi:hypothetical protein